MKNFLIFLGGFGTALVVFAHAANMYVERELEGAGADAYDDGYDDGFDRGRELGYNDGYDDGYDNGCEDTQDYFGVKEDDKEESETCGFCNDPECPCTD